MSPPAAKVSTFTAAAPPSKLVAGRWKFCQGHEVRGASVVGQDVGAGGCGGVVGVGVVDLDIVDGGGLDRDRKSVV